MVNGIPLLCCPFVSTRTLVKSDVLDPKSTSGTLTSISRSVQLFALTIPGTDPKTTLLAEENVPNPCPPRAIELSGTPAKGSTEHSFGRSVVFFTNKPVLR